MSQRCLHDTSTRDVLLSHSGIDIVSWTARKIGYKWIKPTRPKHGNQSQPAVPCGNGAYIHLWLRPNMVHLLIAHLQIFGESHVKRRDPSKNSNYTWKTKCCKSHALVHELHYASLCRSTNIAYKSTVYTYYILHLRTYVTFVPIQMPIHLDLTPISQSPSGLKWPRAMHSQWHS